MYVTLVPPLRILLLLLFYDMPRLNYFQFILSRVSREPRLQLPGGVLKHKLSFALTGPYIVDNSINGLGIARQDDIHIA